MHRRLAPMFSRLARTTGLALVLLASATSSTSFAQSSSGFTSGVAPQDYLQTQDGASLLDMALKKLNQSTIDAAANGGDPEAQYLAALARQGKSAGPAELAKSRYLLRQSAMSGFPRGQFAYGQMLYYGRGGDKSVNEALEWMERAHKSGVLAATYRLGGYYRYDAPEPLRNEKKAHDYFMQSAKLGDVESQTELIVETYSGIGRPADPAAALPELERMATAGSAKANLLLANAYRWGQQVEKSPAKAFEFYSKAAKLGHSLATYQAAWMLSEGEVGTPQPDASVKFIFENARPDDWQSRAWAAKLLISKVARPVPGVEPEKLAFESLEHGYPDGFGTLVAGLREGKFGYKQDLGRAAILSRQGLKVMETLDLSQEGAWPLHALGAAYTIQKAIREKAIAPLPGEVDELLNRYGSSSSGMKRFDVPIRCGDVITQDLTVYVWEVIGDQSPVDNQFEWVEKSKGCQITHETRARYERLFNKSRATGRSFGELLVEDYTNDKRVPPLPPIEF